MKSLEASGDYLLVLGVDGSGKSTFIDGLRRKLGTTILETTSSPEAKAFKRANISTPIDEALIEQRQSLFMALNPHFDATIAAEVASGRNVATTGNGLVTLVSHGLMRSIVDSRSGRAVDKAVDRWLEDDPLRPDCITLVHAPDEVIRDRIMQRQVAGDATERFWGFNSPYFLSRYQKTWHMVLSRLESEVDMPCLRLDSSQLTPEAMLDAYAGFCPLEAVPVVK